MKKRTKNPTPLFYEELRELQDQKVEIRFKNTKYDLSKAIFYGKLEKITLYLFEIKNKHIYFVFDKNNIVSIEKNVITLKSLEDCEKITTQSSNPQLFENLLKILNKYVHIRINKDFYKHPQNISGTGLLRYNKDLDILVIYRKDNFVINFIPSNIEKIILQHSSTTKLFHFLPEIDIVV